MFISRSHRIASSLSLIFAFSSILHAYNSEEFDALYVNFTFPNVPFPIVVLKIYEFFFPVINVLFLLFKLLFLLLLLFEVVVELLLFDDFGDFIF